MHLRLIDSTRGGGGALLRLYLCEVGVWVCRWAVKGLCGLKLWGPGLRGCL